MGVWEGTWQGSPAGRSRGQELCGAFHSCTKLQELTGTPGILGLAARPLQERSLAALLLGTQIQHSAGRASSSCKLHADTHQHHEDVLQGGSRSQADIGSRLSVSQKLSGFIFFWLILNLMEENPH